MRANARCKKQRQPRSKPMNPIILVAVLCGAAILASARPASACTCAMGRVCASYWEADLVFTGRAEVTPLGPGSQRARFRVEESFRGGLAGADVEIVARGLGGSCAYAFVHGTRYLVYARRASDGTWRASFCDPTAPLDQAGESLAFARGIARDSRRGGSLVGFVSIAERADDPAPLPLGGVAIAVRGAARAFSTTADSGGVFAFKDLAPGRYTVTVSTPAGVDPIPSTIVQIKGPGACVVQAVMAVKKVLSALKFLQIPPTRSADPAPPYPLRSPPTCVPARRAVPPFPIPPRPSPRRS